MSETIAAIATAPGQGGVSIVRLSGDSAEEILMQVFKPASRRLAQLESHRLTYGRVMDGQTAIDECMAVLMRAPRSYTREDVCELQLHGGHYTAQRVLALCLREGARLAEPGEFTRRAFLNGRIDLSQAEAVMAVIAAQGEQAHQAAMRQLAGGASSFIREAADALYEIQAGAAACIDYPEEITEEEAASDLSPKTETLAARLESACDERAAHLINEGLTVALCGRPNVGKSSLLNALLGEERAIVTSIPGTTRDMVRGELILGGCLIHLIDTAGVRDTKDPVEAIGVARAEQAIAQADCVLLVLDRHEALTEEDRSLIARIHNPNVIVLMNKSDLAEVLSDEAAAALLPGSTVMQVSAQDPLSLEPLKQELIRRASVSDRVTLTQPRHLEAARRAAAHLRQAIVSMETETIDLAAIDLQSAQMALAEITGDQVEERLLDRVFSTFCVGK